MLTKRSKQKHYSITNKKETKNKDSYIALIDIIQTQSGLRITKFPSPFRLKLCSDH